MENITSLDTLKSAIVKMEADQVEAGQVLKDQFRETYQSFKPVNLIKKGLQNITASPNLVDNLLGTTTGLATGYLTKRIVTLGSASIPRKIIGSLIQIGVTAFLAKNPEAVKSVGGFLHKFLKRKKDNLS